MASSDFTDLLGNLDADPESVGRVLACAATAGAGKPQGGGTFVLGMRSLSVVTGAFAKFSNQASFDPVTSGSDQSVRAALRKGGEGPTNVAPFVFLALGGAPPSVDDRGYLLGISDGDPGFISLVKGRITDGIPDAAPGALGVLRRSTQTVPFGSWVHLRLDATVNVGSACDDVVLEVYANDLTRNSVLSPVWVPVPGITRFVDDTLGANSGSTPLSGAGRIGFGTRFANTKRAAYFDEFVAQRRT